MFGCLKSFFAREDGAITVDWVVLTAAIVGLGIAAVSSARTGIDTLAGASSTAISTTPINNGQ